MKSLNGCSMELSESDKAEFLGLLNRPLSRSHIQMVVRLIGERQELIKLAVETIESGSERETVMASWLLSHLYDSHPGLLFTHQSRMIELALNTGSDSIRRNLLRIIEGIPLPEDQLSALFDRCLAWMISENYAIAVRANAMQVLYRICCIEPGLTDELRAHILALQAFGSAGFKSRAKNVLKKLDALNKN